MKQRIAYFRPAPFPLANAMLENVLQSAFPEYNVDVFDVFAAVRRNPTRVLVNTLHTLRLYGLDILKRRKQFQLAFWRTPYIFQAVKQWITRRQSAVDYVFSFQIQALFDASLPGRPHFIYTDHTHLANRSYPDFTASRLYAPAWIDLEHTIYQNAAINFVRSTNIAYSVMDDYGCPPERVQCVYAGANISVPDAAFSPAIQAKRCQEKHILFVGIDWERKGGPDLLAAFPLVLAEHPDAHLTIVGCSPEVDLPNVTVVGRMPPEQVSPYFQAASLFCMPTYNEPFGIVYVEALANGLPIVATNVGAVPDMIQDCRNGFLVTPGDVEGIAQAINLIFSRPDLCASFGEASLQLAQERYSWASVGRRLREHISPLIGQE